MTEAIFGVTESGFVPKRTVDILVDLLNNLSGVVDPETGESLTLVLTDENDPVAQLVNASADALGVCWEQLQLAYNQFDPLKNTGAGQSGTVQLNGLTRLPGSYSQATLLLTGTPYLTFPAGKQVSTMDGTVTFTLPVVSMDGSGSASVVAVATVKGPLEAPSGTICKIVTAVPGWSAVTNPEDATLGALEESHSDLRARQQVSTAWTASAIIESIFSGVANIPGVTFCKVYQNLTMVEDGRTIPAKSIAVVALGGDDAEIAQMIFSRNPLAGTYGSTTVSIVDAQGISYPISFSRPTLVDVYAQINVSVVDQTKWPTDGEDEIIANVVALNGSYLPGQPVFASDLYAPTLETLGIKITGIFVDVEADPAADEADFDWDEIANFSSDKIEVTVTGAP